MNLDLCKTRSQMNLNFLILTKNFHLAKNILNRKFMFEYIYIFGNILNGENFIVVSGGHVSRHICGSTNRPSNNCIECGNIFIKLQYKMRYRKKRSLILEYKLFLPILKSLWWKHTHGVVSHNARNKGTIDSFNSVCKM